MRRKVSGGRSVAAAFMEGDMPPVETMRSTADEIVAGLNPEQLEVVKHDRGPLLVGAVAGAGKTAALVRRIAYLIVAVGVDARRILAVTFSKKAADEMNERLLKFVPDCEARVGTWHSLALQFVRQELGLGEWEVDKESRYRIILKDVLGWRGMRWETADLTEVAQYIDLCKASCAPPGTDAARAIAKEYYDEKPCAHRSPTLLFEAYERTEIERRNRQLLTFDDMLLEMWHAMSRDEACRARWAARWDYVLQDECQDENLVQREIASMLVRDHRNYMMVGDPAQAIYGFRGSDPKGMLTFEERFPGARVVRMHRNYRSGAAIATASNGVLAAMAEGTHLGMTMTPERADVPGVVVGRGYLNMDAEGKGVAEEIQQLNADGVAWKDCVVLYRTNAQSRGVEEAMLSARIPYVVVGGTNFYDRREVKDLIGYLRVSAGIGRWDDVRRCLNAPFRYLGKAFLERVEEASGGRASFGRGPSATADREGGGPAWTEIVRVASSGGGLQGRQRHSALEWCAMIDGMARKIAAARSATAAGRYEGPEVDEAKPARLLEDILMQTEYVRWLTKDEGTESTENNRVSNVRELVRSAERFLTVDDLLAYVEQTIAASKTAQRGESPDRVTLMSIHRSKGLEWPRVFVIGCNEKILPHARGDENEERRLAYVAFTRARDVLTVSSVRTIVVGEKVVPSNVSRFVIEAGIEYSASEPVAQDAEVNS